MTTISREIEINASKEEVWNAIAKFGDICHASPGVLKSHVTSEQQDGVGIGRVVSVLSDGLPAERLIKVTIVEFIVGIIGLVMLLKYKEEN